MASAQDDGIFQRIRSKLEKKTRRLIGRTRRLLGIAYVSPLGEADVFDLLRGKSVALVGNARSLSERTQGAAIDAHDIVIRCNAAPVPDSRSHGAKTDIIATSIDFSFQVMETRKAHYLFWMSPRRDAMPGWVLKWPGFFLYPDASYRTLFDAVGSRPTTGLMVVDLLARSDCSRASLFGFDFFRSQSLSGEWRKATMPHDYATEERYITDLLREDPKFSLD